MASFEICEEGGKADGCGDGEEGGAIGGWREEVEQRGEKKAGGFFFGREPQELGVESEDFLFSMGAWVSLVELLGRCPGTGRSGYFSRSLPIREPSKLSCQTVRRTW